MSQTLDKGRLRGVIPPNKPFPEVKESITLISWVGRGHRSLNQRDTGGT